MSINNYCLFYTCVILLCHVSGSPFPTPLIDNVRHNIKPGLHNDITRKWKSTLPLCGQRHYGLLIKLPLQIFTS